MIAADVDDRRDPPSPLALDDEEVVERLVDALDLTGHERVLVLDVTARHQDAVLARLAALGCMKVEVHAAHDERRSPSATPFDRILVTAAPPGVPVELVEQLADGGILVLPFGALGRRPSLLRVRKTAGKVDVEDLG